MNDNELYDELFETVLNKAIEKFDNQPDSSLPEVKPVEFSESHKKRMKKLFLQERRKERFRNFCKNSKRIAACFLIFVVVSGIAVMSVSALRIRVLNLIFNNNETNTDIKFRESNEDDLSVDKYGYNIGYVPSGFLLIEQNTSNNMMRFKFSNTTEDFTILIYSIDGSASADTENSKYEIIIINGKEAFFNENNNGKMLSMQNDDHIIVISGTISKEEIIKIAQNLKKE